jgi:hypothetical protein
MFAKVSANEVYSAPVPKGYVQQDRCPLVKKSQTSEKKSIPRKCVSQANDKFVKTERKRKEKKVMELS